MKILVTGSKGFIGSNLYERLKKNGHDVKGFDILDYPTYRPNDLSIQDFDWVIHLGAISSTTETNVQKLMDKNLSWSIELLEKCQSETVNMQFASSASVYGIRTKEEGPFKETDCCRPMNYYAMSKYLFEQYIKAKQIETIKVQCLRYFNVYGPKEEHKDTQASPYTQFTKQAKETASIRVFEDSDQYMRDFIPVETVCDYHEKFLLKNISGIFNIGTGTPKSFLQVAEEISFKHNARIETVQFPQHLRSHYQTYTCADMSFSNSILETE